ncbi:MAG TPA: undecaprenyl-diphosphate phosphatase [Cyclobacteriaceae bacterium]|nr:undecaprenyl-diphosphate phosphatase [Cyclobacteriaceae bacterium]
MSVIEAIILAIIEGITEFLPVSSTGHIIIGSTIMGIADDSLTKLFTVAIQFGAILSVIVLYWKRFFQTFDFYRKLFVAFLPAAVIGLLLGDFINVLLERVDIVGYMLVLGGIFFLFTDKLFAENETKPTEGISYPVALKIGFFQALALVPGVSRSAATIIGGLTQKLNRKTAAEFSFFLAVPTMFAASGYKLFTYYLDGGTFGERELLVLAVGNVVAFLVALLAIRSFISYLTRHGFKVFGYYRIVLGLAILILYYMGVDLALV